MLKVNDKFKLRSTENTAREFGDINRPCYDCIFTVREVRSDRYKASCEHFNGRDTYHIHFNDVIPLERESHLPGWF